MQGLSLEITKRFTFEAAHYLEGYDGLCGHVHGHSYKVEITVASKPGGGLIDNGPERGMVMDLTRLKTCAQPVIDDFDQLDVRNARVASHVVRRSRSSRTNQTLNFLPGKNFSASCGLENRILQEPEGLAFQNVCSSLVSSGE